MREQTADIQQKVATELAALETPYEMLDIDPAFADTAAFCEKYGYELGVSAKHDRHRFKTRTASSFAPASYWLIPGSMSITPSGD